MARPRQPASGRRRQGKLPRLTKNGKPLTPQEQKENIENWVGAEFEEELRLTAFLDVNTRRQIRLATGVGDIETFVDEFNNGFANSSQNSLDESTKSKPGDRAFGETWSDRPRLKKLNTEVRVIYRPAST